MHCMKITPLKQGAVVFGQVAVDSGREVTEMFPVLLLESTLNELLLNQRH